MTPHKTSAPNLPPDYSVSGALTKLISKSNGFTEKATKWLVESRKEQRKIADLKQSRLLKSRDR